MASTVLSCLIKCCPFRLDITHDISGNMKNVLFDKVAFRINFTTLRQPPMMCYGTWQLSFVQTTAASIYAVSYSAKVLHLLSLTCQYDAVQQL